MEFVEVEGFAIIGIEAPTSFECEKGAHPVLPGMWSRFRNASLAAIPNRSDGNSISLYSSYESDEYGGYVTTLGARVITTEHVPEGMVVRHIPAGRYAVFHSERGPAEKVVFDTWKRIWKEPRTPEYTRSYVADFEVHYSVMVNPDDPAVDVFIGVK